MKDTFPGYTRKSSTEIKNIWQEGIIFFDTNVLLNLYRYSKSTRETIIDLIGKFKDQIWLPHQAALEYNKNRYEVIADQEKTYKEFINKIHQIQKDLQSTSKPPFFSESVSEELNTVLRKVNSEVEESITKYCGYLKDDPIYDKLSKIFESRITDTLGEEELNMIFEEGEKRYKMKVPPGYEDAKKKEENQKFGDLILWKQVIAKAKELSKPVILVTDERKTDWWWKIKDGRNMGPRHELITEMRNKAKVDFHMYSSEKFLSYGQEYLKEQINKRAFDEIIEMKKAEIKHYRNLEKIKQLGNERSYINAKGAFYFRNKYDEITNQIKEIELEQEDLFIVAQDNLEIQEYINTLDILKAELEEELMHLRKKYNMTRLGYSKDEMIRNNIINFDKSIEFKKRQNKE